MIKCEVTKKCPDYCLQCEQCERNKEAEKPLLDFYSDKKGDKK